MKSQPELQPELQPEPKETFKSSLLTPHKIGGFAAFCELVKSS
jgi:hypothetical protein